MREPFLALAGILATVVALQSTIRAQAADAPLPVSMERIRAGLKRPPPLLQVPAPSDETPTFRIEVRARPLILQPPDEEPFDPTLGLPSAGELLMRGIERLRSAAAGYTRRRAERRARTEVDAALAAFCAVRDCSTANPDK